MSRASRDEVSPPSFTFTDSMTCLYKGISISLDKFKDMIHAQIAEARQTLYDHLFLGFYDPLKFPTPQNILDDPSNIKVDYSFLSDRHNHLGDRYKHLLDTILQSPDKQQYFCYAADGTLVWNHVNCEAYLSKAQQFLRALLIAMHLSHGQPT